MGEVVNSPGGSAQEQPLQEQMPPQATSTATTSSDEEGDTPSSQRGAARAGQPEVTLEMLQREVARRRNFAIISHPDAGKTTLVSKEVVGGRPLTGEAADE